MIKLEKSQRKVLHLACVQYLQADWQQEALKESIRLQEQQQ